MRRGTTHLRSLLPASRAGRLALLAGTLPLLLVLSCSKPGSKVVAEVNGRKITVADVVLQYRSMSVTVRPFVDTLEGKRGFLNDMINRELLLEETRARKLDQAPEVELAIKQFEDGLLAEKYYAVNVSAKVQVSDAELRDLYEKQAEEARLRLIVVDSEDQAREIQQALRSGGDFAALARERSTDPSRTRGGDLDFHTWADFAEALAKAARPLKEGELSEVFPLENGFALVLLESRRPTTRGDFESEKNDLALKLRAIKEAAVAREWNARKRAETSIQVNPAAVALLSQRMNEALNSRFKFRGQAPLQITDADREMPLATFSGRTWTVDDYLSHLTQIRLETRPKLTASLTELSDFISNLAVRDLAVEEARNMGLADDPEVKTAVARQREKLTLTRLHREIAAVDSIPEDELQRYYDEHRASLIAPARARILEAVLPTEQEARQWLGQVRGGSATMKQVAQEQSIDRELAALGGESDWMYRSANPSALEKAVFATETNKAGGPVHTDKGWVIYRVLEKEGEVPMSFQEARASIQKQLADEKRTRLFDDWLAARREKADVKIIEKVLTGIDFGAPPRSDPEGEGAAPAPVT